VFIATIPSAPAFIIDFAISPILSTFGVNLTKINVFEGLTGHIDIDEKNDSTNYAKVKKSGIKLKEACERYI